MPGALVGSAPGATGTSAEEGERRHQAGMTVIFSTWWPPRVNDGGNHAGLAAPV